MSILRKKREFRFNANLTDRRRRAPTPSPLSDRARPAAEKNDVARAQAHRHAGTGRHGIAPDGPRGQAHLQLGAGQALWLQPDKHFRAKFDDLIHGRRDRILEPITPWLVGADQQDILGQHRPLAGRARIDLRRRRHLQAVWSPVKPDTVVAGRHLER